MTTPRPRPPHRLASTLTTLVVPLVVIATTVLVARSWEPRLPDPVATHWPASGGPDGFGPARDLVVAPLAFVPLVAIGMWALAFWVGRDTSTRRLAAGFSTGLAVLMAGVTLGSLGVQLDLADATRAPGVGGVVALASVVATVAGLGVALLVPRTPHHPTHDAVDPAAPRADLAPGERAAWSRTVTSTAGAWVGVGAIVLNVGLALAMRTPALLLVAAVLSLLLASTLVMRVTVDGRGLVARSVVGWPAVRVPLDEVVAARTTRVDPFGEFGGWGYRVGADGRVGFVLRRGDAVEVQRTGGRVNVVTVDDAATAASLLNTLADRARGTAGAR